MNEACRPCSTWLCCHLIGALRTTAGDSWWVACTCMFPQASPWMPNVCHWSLWRCSETAFIVAAQQWQLACDSPTGCLCVSEWDSAVYLFLYIGRNQMWLVCPRDPLSWWLYTPPAAYILVVHTSCIAKKSYSYVDSGQAKARVPQIEGERWRISMSIMPWHIVNCGVDLISVPRPRLWYYIYLGRTVTSAGQCCVHQLVY